MIQDPKKTATRARHAAFNAAADEISTWYDAENAKLAADTTLSDAERKAKRAELRLEMGRRAKRAEGKARRNNTAAKVLEREALDRIRDRRDD